MFAPAFRSAIACCVDDFFQVLRSWANSGNGPIIVFGSRPCWVTISATSLCRPLLSSCQISSDGSIRRNAASYCFLDRGRVLLAQDAASLPSSGPYSQQSSLQPRSFSAPGICESGASFQLPTRMASTVWSVTLMSSRESGRPSSCEYSPSALASSLLPTSGGWLVAACSVAAKSRA